MTPGADLASAPEHANDHEGVMRGSPFFSPSASDSHPSLHLANDKTVGPRPLPAALLNNHSTGRYGSLARQQQSEPYNHGSMSSSGTSSEMTKVPSLEFEKTSELDEGTPQRSTRESRQHSKRGSKHSGAGRDPEKAMYSASRHGSHDSDHSLHSRVAYVEGEEEQDEGRQTQERKAVKILIFLSGPCVGLSMMNAAWAVVALVITALSQPIRICAKRPSFGEQLGGLLGPTLNLQLRCIYTPLPPHANDDRSYNNAMLFFVHILSPFLSFVVMFMAWVLAVYWVASGIIGDPAGQDRQDDGKETVLGLRTWWERWLMRSVRE